MTSSSWLRAGGALLLLAALLSPGPGPKGHDGWRETPIPAALAVDAAPPPARASLAAALHNFADEVQRDALRSNPSWLWSSVLYAELGRKTRGLGQQMPETSKAVGEHLQHKFGFTGPIATRLDQTTKLAFAEELRRISALVD